MAFNLADKVNRASTAGTLRFNVAASANGNTTITAATTYGSGTVGTLTQLVAAMALGNSANTTANGNILIYDGSPAAGNLIYTLVGNTASTINLSTAIGAPIVNGCVTMVGQANCPAAWFSFMSGGSNGQPGNLT